jgi:hypothetical protein
MLRDGFPRYHLVSEAYGMFLYSLRRLLRCCAFDPLSLRDFRLLPTFTLRIKKMRQKAHVFYGGERGIRTPGTFRHNGFQDRRFQPLTHLSANGNNLKYVFESR